MRLWNRFCYILFVLISFCHPGTVFSAGFMVREHSTSGLSTAFAGVHTGSHDLADMYFNPASLGLHNPGEAAICVLQLNPTVRFTLKSSTTAVGGAIGGSPGGEDAAPTATIPAIYASLAEKRGWRFGLAVNAPWGLKTNYPPGWVGRYHAIDSEMTSLTVMPVAARKLDSKWHFGAGLNIQTIEAKLNNAVDYGSIGAAGGVPGAAPTAQDGTAEVNGDARDVGFVLCLICDISTKERVGFSYRSAVRHTLKGDGSFTFDPSGMAAALNGVTGMFGNTGARADITTPEVFGIGYSHTCGASWTVMLDAAKTFWHRYGGLTVVFDNPAQPDAVTAEDWFDVWYTSLGAVYRASPRLSWRFGIARDRSPVPENRRTPRIPGSDSRQFAIGAEYRSTDHMTLSAGFMRIFYADAPIDLRAGEPGNLLRGSLSGNFATGFDIYGIQASYTW